MLRRLNLLIITGIFWCLCSSFTLAETKKPEDLDKFPPSPLEITTPDPLLPPLVDKQPLSAEELQKLEIALDELDQQAAATLQAGDRETAFNIWNRELRLRRFLGTLAEVQALGRVGEIAWNENERQQVQYITQRLQVIEKQMLKEKNADLELWRSLGATYQQIRYPKLAIAAYEQILALVRQQKNSVAELETLQTIAELHISWFDYSQAGKTYQELLSLVTARGNSADQVIYLQKLAYIYDQGKQHSQAIEVLNKLVDIYTNENNFTPIAELKLAIASHYEILAKEDPSQLQNAFNNYQAAYTTAWQLQQYVRASEALEKLITLYRSQKQTDAALQTSQILIQTQTLASNFYGLMQAYDQIGQLHLERQEYSQALTAFQQGLDLAKQLKHQEAYFTQQIEKLSTINN
jgi:tetratricopeptide (TPR) repeat protein